jgi:STE24 endopeptidase
VVSSTLLALAVADVGARLLRPRKPLIEPAPVDIGSYFSAEEIERGRGYARPQRALALARTASELAALVAIVRRGGSGGGRRRLSPVPAGAATGAGLTIALSTAPLPFSALARRRSIKVGLITQSWGGWASDLIKSTLIESALGGAAGAAVIYATRRYPRGWWLAAAGGSVLAGTVLVTVGPVLLDPIFNKFTPLPEGETRSDVLELARAAGVKVGEVYSIDASRRTTAANAYVTGLGPSKRVVLFDTLLDRYNRDEIRVVVAHELSHVRSRDIWRSVLYAAMIAPPLALAVQRLSWEISPERGTAATLPVLALSAGLLSAPVGVAGKRLSRAIERRADGDSLEWSRSPEAFISFERAIALQNVADLEPPGWVSSLLATHPPTDQRIGAAVSYANQASEARP